MTVSDECLVEIKKTATADSHVVVAAQATTTHVGWVIDCTQFSSLKGRLQVTSIVLACIAVLLAKVEGDSEPHEVETQINYARMLWLRDIQAQLPGDAKFPV